MDRKQVSETVDALIAEEQLPVSAGLKRIRRYDLYTDMDESEIEAYWDFISWHLGQEHLLLLSIPKPEESDFWGADLDELGNNESAMNTHDFERLYPFNKYHYKLKKMCERVKDLALTHSCISDVKGRINIKNRFLNLVRSDCQEKKMMFFGNCMSFSI